nr:helicase C-terminal domain-containing protein [Candidatus Sigynarchaeota archaeon]
MLPEEYLEKARKNSASRRRPITKILPDQVKMANVVFESMKLPHVVQVAQGPTGMGKTLVVLSVAAALNDIKKKVLIAAPTHNHIQDNMNRDGELVFDEIPPTLYGITHKRYNDARAKCPRGLEACTNPWSKECQNFTGSCLIVADYKKCSEANTVFTTHAYVAVKPSVVEKYDVLLVDESHGLPNVIQGQRQRVLTMGVLTSLLAKQYDAEVRSLLEQAIADMERLQRIAARATPPKAMGNRIIEKVKQAANKAGGANPLHEWTFFHSVDHISSDAELTVIRYGAKHEWSDSLSVGLVSATVEDPRAHVKDCGFEQLVLRPKEVIDSPEFHQRFLSRPIFAIMDGPRLAKGDAENYQTFRQQANGLIAVLIEAVPDQVTLILCQNKDDAQSIRESLQKFPALIPRLTILPDDTEDADSCEEMITKEVAAGKNVIIATASSKLWEGANVPGLRYVILDALPYRRPSAAELESTGPKASQSWKSMKRFMLNRVQQGVGRLVRHEGDWGIAVIIDERFYSNKQQFLKELPRYIKSTEILRWVTKDQAPGVIRAMASRLSKPGGTARVNQDLFQAIGKLRDE